jgi:hypothetical protein
MIQQHLHHVLNFFNVLKNFLKAGQCQQDFLPIKVIMNNEIP